MKTLEERIAALEKSNRRWRSAVVVLGTAVAGIAAAKPVGTTDLVRTRRLEVVDASNKLVAEISNGADTRIPGAEINLFTPDGKKAGGFWAKGGNRNLVSINGDAGSMTILPDSLSIYANYQNELPSLKRGGDLIAIMDQHTRVRLGTSDKDAGYVRVYNQRGEMVADMR